MQNGVENLPFTVTDVTGYNFGASPLESPLEDIPNDSCYYVALRGNAAGGGDRQTFSGGSTVPEACVGDPGMWRDRYPGVGSAEGWMDEEVRVRVCAFEATAFMVFRGENVGGMSPNVQTGVATINHYIGANYRT